jgi:hypothetical protein
MRGGGEPGIIERWKHVAGQEPNSQYRAEYGVIVTTFAELTGRAVIWKSKLEGWNMQESPFLAGFRAEFRAEGMAEGRADARRSDLLEVLELKFGAPTPPDLVAMIQGHTDLVVLSRWFKASFRAETFDALRGELAG